MTRGCTLIELMIVICKIGVLAAIAIPQYQNYLFRTRWSDNFAAVGRLKQAAAECMQNDSMIGPPTSPCDSTASLVTAGFLPTGSVDPVLKVNHGIVSYTGDTFHFMAGDLTGTASCTVELRAQAVQSPVQWHFANATPAVCNRTLTRRGHLDARH